MYLVWDSPRGRVVHELARALTIIGSDEVSDFRVEHGSVSRRHALVQVEDSTVRITDLGSTNGTKINGAALVPDLPSTLEPGDFINLGEMLLGFHRTPPPAPAPEPAPRQARRRAPPAPRLEARGARPFPWLWVAAALGVLLVGCLGALIAILAAKTESHEEPPRAKVAEAAPKPEKPGTGEQAPEQPDDTDGPAPKSKAEPGPEPKPEPEPLLETPPPPRWASVEDCPDLLALYGGGYAAVKLITWDKNSVEALGCDGKRYGFLRGAVTKIMDRADLARRAERDIANQSVDDAKGCFGLAKWCFERHIRAPLKPFLKRVVAARPDDPVRVLLDAIGADERKG